MITNFNVYAHNRFGLICNEYFDLSDTKTRRSLIGLNEADQQQILGNLAAKLYKQITDKVTEIDYQGIPLSKGDIMQVQNMTDMLECLKIIEETVAACGDKAPVSVVYEAIENMKSNKKLFQKGFNVKNGMVELIYNNMVLAIVSTVNLLLATTVDYVSNPYSEYSFTINSSDKTRQHLLFRNLYKFNTICKNGEFTSTLEAVLKGQKAVEENTAFVAEADLNIVVGGIIGTVAMIRLLMLVLPIIHELVYFFYSARMKVADYFDMQAKIVTLNAERVKNSTIKTKEEREKIVKKQLKIADAFRKIANTLEIKYNKGTNEAEKAISADSKKNYKIDDVVDSKPDSANDDIF